MFEVRVASIRLVFDKYEPDSKAERSTTTGTVRDDTLHCASTTSITNLAVIQAWTLGSCGGLPKT
jgi:hypothetical protein